MANYLCVFMFIPMRELLYVVNGFIPAMLFYG